MHRLLLLSSVMLLLASCGASSDPPRLFVPPAGHAPFKPSPTLDALEVLLRLPNLLDYPSVYRALGATPGPREVYSFSGYRGSREPAHILLKESPLSRFDGVTVEERVLFSGRDDDGSSDYETSVAVAYVTLNPDFNPGRPCIRMADVSARFGPPASMPHEHSSPGVEMPDIVIPSWLLSISGGRRVKLAVGPVSLTPTDADVTPGMREVGGASSGMFVDGPSDCVQFGFSVEEVRPGFRYTDIRPRLPIPPEPPKVAPTPVPIVY